MSAERIPEKAPPLRLVAGGPDDAISAWLGVLVRFLRVPAPEAESIREELESHLRERVRDLEVTGIGEEEAVRQAVSELGDAAGVAQRYREARAFPRRRLMMNMSMLAMTGGAVAISVVALMQPGGDSGRVSVFTPPAPTASEQTALTRKMDTDFRDTSFGNVMKAFSQSMDIPVNVVWRDLQDRGLSSEENVNIVGERADFATILKLVREQLSDPIPWTLAYRIEDGAVKVASDEYFDRREIVLASYDLSGLHQATPEEFVAAIHTFVHRDGWQNNGGDIANCCVVGSKAFIQAPKRYHAEVKWFVDELSKGPALVEVELEQERLDAKRAEVASLLKAAADRSEARVVNAAEAERAMLLEQIRDLESQKSHLEKKLSDAAVVAADIDADRRARALKEIPAAISDADIAKLDRHAAMKEWTGRKRAAGQPGLSAEIKERLLEESDKCRMRMSEAREY